MDAAGETQVIASTHSSFLASLPGATLLRLDRYGFDPVALEDTDHFRLMRAFALDWRSVVDGVLNG